jgi:extracellular matrix regulatory protein A
MHVGYDNYVPHWKVAAILAPRGNPAKRFRAAAHLDGRLMDATGGRKTRSLVVTDANQVILSAINPETLRERLEKRRQAEREGA